VKFFGIEPFDLRDDVIAGFRNVCRRQRLPLGLQLSRAIERKKAFVDPIFCGGDFGASPSQFPASSGEPPRLNRDEPIARHGCRGQRRDYRPNWDGFRDGCRRGNERGGKRYRIRSGPRDRGNGRGRLCIDPQPHFKAQTSDDDLFVHRYLRVRKDDDREAFLRRRGFSKGETGKVIDMVLSEEGRPPESIFDFVQGITALARGKSHQDARLDLEQRAGKLLAGVR